jgi:beta-lactamase regulating signal transducer with metallopeptidase domain
MAELRDGLLQFLGLTSIQLLTLAAVSAVLLRLLRMRGAAALRILVLVVAVPFLWPAARALPPTTRIPVPEAVAEVWRSDAATTAAAIPASPATGARGPDWRDLALAAWAAAVAVLGARILVGLARVRRLLRRSRPVRDRDARRTLARCCRRIGLARAPRMRASRECLVPFVAGLLRPTLVLPERYLDAHRSPALRFALLHELAHVRRGDLRWVAPELLLRTVYFFHLPLQRALSRMREEREHRCDADVVRITGEPASYAAFLLREIRDAGNRAVVMGLGHRPSAVARRVHRIANGEESPTMRNRIGMHCAVATVAATLALLLTLGPATAAAEEVELDGINANPTETKGVYHVTPVYAELRQVYAFRRGGPYGKEHRKVFAAGTDYTFHAATGRLHLMVTLDDEAWMLHVDGVRAMPWAWRTDGCLAPGKTTIHWGDRAGVRGVDFEVDEKAGLIRLLREELCDKKLDYRIDYRYVRDPARPNAGRGGAIIHTHGHAPAKKKKSAGTAGFAPGKVGTNASATADPRTWFLVRPMRSEDLHVAVTKREGGDKRALTRGADFAYDEQAGVISLMSGIAIDTDTEFLFVHGLPRVRNVFSFRRALEQGTVAVVLGSRLLVEGTGYTVDYAKGVVTVLDRGISDPKAKFYVKAGEGSFGSHDDLELVRRLLSR